MFAIVCLAGSGACHAQKAEMPAPSQFTAGDAWEWRQIDSRTKLEEGKLSRIAINADGILMFSNGTSNLPISHAFLGEPTTKPWRVWPLEVGNKWVYDFNWSRPDGVTGNTQQDSNVVAYEEVQTPAGNFMAFKIEYRGTFRNSRGKSGRQNDTYWYAPQASADVKHVRDDGYNTYVRELVSYKRGTP